MVIKLILKSDEYRFRYVAALKACSLHLLLSGVLALIVGFFIFRVWYPHPYGELSGGKNIFLLLIGVDVVCGPLLMLILFDKLKSRSELLRDIGLIAIIQLAALGYGVFTVWQARPLFLVQEIDRFKVISAPDLLNSSISSLPKSLMPAWHTGPIAIAIRAPVNEEERLSVLFESIRGGRDYAERPEFYLPYAGENALKSIKFAKPLPVFLKRWPNQLAAAENIASEAKIDLLSAVYLPVVGREDWIAVLNYQGQIQGFLKGDGF